MPRFKNFTETKLRFPSKKCDKRSFRFVKPNKNTRILICCPKNKMGKKRCKVGMKGVAKLTRKK